MIEETTYFNYWQIMKTRAIEVLIWHKQNNCNIYQRIRKDMIPFLSTID